MEEMTPLGRFFLAERYSSKIYLRDYVVDDLPLVPVIPTTLSLPLGWS